MAGANHSAEGDTFSAMFERNLADGVRLGIVDLNVQLEAIEATRAALAKVDGSRRQDRINSAQLKRGMSCMRSLGIMRVQLEAIRPD